MERCEDLNRMQMETEKSVVTDANSKDFFGPPEKLGLGFQMGEPTSMEWTDEKHSLYLNFMEASFVNQLYNREYSSMDSSGWLSRGREQVGSGPSRSNPSNPSSSDQFKVLRSGCWQKLDFERARSQQDLGDESRVLMANPWVRHFRTSINGKGTEVTSPNLQENDMSVCNDTQFEGQKHTFTTLGVATYSKPPTIYCKDFDFLSTGTTEVSDQNFVDESSNCKGDQLNSSCGKKRVRNATANLSSKDQVVPFSNSDPSSINHLEKRKTKNVNKVKHTMQTPLSMGHQGLRHLKNSS